MNVPIRALGVPLKSSKGPQSERKPLESAASSRRGNEPAENEPTRFMPEVRADLWAPIVALLEQQEGDALRHSLLKRASELRALATPDHLAARCACLVLADLQRQSWHIELRGAEPWVTAPLATTAAGERPETVKERLRNGLRATRALQLEDPAVRSFINRMEARRNFRGNRFSVLDLVDDGHDLAMQLAEAAKLPPSERAIALRTLVRPTVQIAESGVRCESTGLDLIDIWRYFRHTWSLEYRPTPGRTMMFIVRNAARRNAPVMAIGALANATLQLAVRDEWLGWTPASLMKRLAREPDYWQTLHPALMRTLEEAQALIRSDDLYAQAGEVTGALLESRLLAMGNDALSERTKRLNDRSTRISQGEKVGPIKQLPTSSVGGVDWRAASEAPLFVAKRAKTLADLLFARRVLAGASSFPTLDALTDKSGDLARAITIAMREVRKVGLASRLLELNVCGAVPPYRDLLGGKLAALTVASSEIRRAYAARYSKQVSEIASQMAGREVVREADVCVIATTSLYGLSASQYNRLKVKVSDKEVIQWHDLEETKGFGTTHLSEDTVRALRDLCEQRRGGRNVNNLFGEGTSPRLRQLREGLSELGLDANKLLNHAAPRRVYALEVFPGARQALCLNAASNTDVPSFEEIAEAWRGRWLSNRITFREALDRTSTQDAASVRADLALPNQRQLALFDRGSDPPPRRAPQPTTVHSMRKQSNLPLIESLYRAPGACADHHDAGTVRTLHIETAIDDFLRRRAPAGGLVFVTGNPGDGKTHLLRRLEPELAAAKMDVILDANEEVDEALIKRIDGATRKKSRGLAVAINEGVLVNLLRAASDRAWARAAREQLLNPFVHRGHTVDADPSVTVLDLNLRNNLAESVVRRALEKILQLSGPCDVCPGKNCSLQFNAERLGGPASERLVALLDAVARTGFHATMRDLQGFLSFTLFGHLQCNDFKKGTHSRYWHNAFEGGQGPLFEAVARFDPQHQTMPLLDDALWRGSDQASDWGTSHAEVTRTEATLEERRDGFIDRKRRALFEHSGGQAILAAAGSSVDRALNEVLAGGQRAVNSLVRLLNRFFDRDEERSDLLYLWVSHRFDAQPSRFAAASQAIGRNDLEVITLSLRADLAQAFPEYRPGHVVLCAKDQAPSEGLRVDRPLIEALMAGEQGLPSTFRRGEPEARVAAFFDRLAKRRRVEADDSVEVRLVDMDTGANLRVPIDVRARAYMKP